MARPRRLIAPHSLHHVMARGNERRPIFRDDDDRRLYLSRLARYRERDGFRLLAYCLMSNHVHLAIETGDVGLPRTMAGLQFSYTQAFNRKYRRVGHLFQGRYKAIVVDRESYGQMLIRYIHQNPVVAGLVRREADYRWSSARAWSRGSGPEWLDVRKGLELFGSTRARALESYRIFRSDAGDEPYEAMPVIGSQVLGTEAFADGLRPRRKAERGFRRKVSLDELTAEVARREGLSVEAVRAPGQRRAEARVRAMVALRAQEEGGVSLVETARYFGRDGSTLAKAVARLRDDG